MGLPVVRKEALLTASALNNLRLGHQVVLRAGGNDFLAKVNGMHLGDRGVVEAVEFDPQPLVVVREIGGMRMRAELQVDPILVRVGPDGEILTGTSDGSDFLPEGLTSGRGVKRIEPSAGGAPLRLVSGGTEWQVAEQQNRGVPVEPGSWVSRRQLAPRRLRELYAEPHPKSIDGDRESVVIKAVNSQLDALVSAAIALCESSTSQSRLVAGGELEEAKTYLDRAVNLAGSNEDNGRIREGWLAYQEARKSYGGF